MTDQTKTGDNPGKIRVRPKKNPDQKKSKKPWTKKARIRKNPGRDMDGPAPDSNKKEAVQLIE
jgi:hypothetical protein